MNKIILDNKIFYYQVFFKKNKNMYLRVKNKLITITAPKHFEIEQIESFIIQHQKFVLKQNNTVANNQLYKDDYFELFGEKYSIINYPGKKLYLDEKEAYLPENISNKIIEKFYQNQLILRVKNMIDQELKIILKEIDFNGLVLKSRLMKSRLGSCNKTKRIINLNSILARLNPIYLRAVLIHELVHLKVANHQKGFYNLLLKYEPKYREIRRELNEIVKTYEI